MNWQLVPLAQVEPSAWRNGGGRTRELLAWPSPADWRLRISVADIDADGPFSAFPGIERWFAVLEGEGVALQVDGAPQRLSARAEPFRFDGAARVDCKLLAGPTRDFNLMAAPGRATLRRLHGAALLDVATASLVALYAHDATASVTFAAQSLQVAPATLAWCLVDAPAQMQVQAPEALWMEVLP